MPEEGWSRVVWTENIVQNFSSHSCFHRCHPLTAHFNFGTIQNDHQMECHSHHNIIPSVVPMNKIESVNQLFIWYLQSCSENLHSHFHSEYGKGKKNEFCFSPFTIYSCLGKRWKMNKEKSLFDFLSRNTQWFIKKSKNSAITNK